MLTPVAPLRLISRPQWFAPVWLIVAIVISTLLHVGFLFVQFVLPDNTNPSKAVIEMILVNDYNQLKNDDATVFANAALKGGGNAESGRKTSPLMRDDEEKNGNALQKQQSQIEATEKSMKQQLLAAKKSSLKEFDTASLQPSDRQEWQEAFEAIARRQAEIEKNIQDYNARPRKYFDGPSTNSHEAALYVQQWRSRVEDWGNQHYPEEARGKVYGDVVITVEIDKTGRALAINVGKSSGSDMLDRAAVDSIRRSAPFGQFTESMKNKMDVLVLTRTWSYSSNGLATKAEPS